jgi:hypothetical protein
VFRAPFHFASQALKSAPVEPVISDEPVVVEKPSWWTGRAIDSMRSSSFKTLSELQHISNSNEARDKYNESVFKSVQDLSEFAGKYKSTDTVAVIKSLKKELKGKFNDKIVVIPEVGQKSTFRTQLFGEYLNDPLIPNHSSIHVAGFITQASFAHVGGAVMNKAIKELVEALAKDPLSDKAILLFNQTLKRLKKDGLLNEEEVKTALSGEAGKALEASYSEACKRVLKAAEPNDLSSVRNILKSHSSALSVSFGFKGVNVTALFETIQAEQEVAVKEKVIADEAKWTDLETQQAELQKRVDLDKRVDAVARKVGTIMTDLKKLKASQNTDIDTLQVRQKTKAKSLAAVDEHLAKLGVATEEAKAVRDKIIVGDKKSKEVELQIESKEIELKAAQLEQKLVIGERAQFNRAHKFGLYPEHDLKKVEAKLKLLEEGLPVSQPQPPRRRWLVPTTLAVTTVAAVAGAVFAAKSFVF